MEGAFLGTLLGNVAIALGIFFFMLILSPIKKKLVYKVDYITSLTVGLLLGIIFLGFFPEIILESEEKENLVGMYILLGLGLFYVLELAFHWHHCKDLEIECHNHNHEHTHTYDQHHTDEHKNTHLMFFGTFLHNAFHGIELFTAYSISTEIGIVTTLAIFLHAIPQNIAHFVMNPGSQKPVYIAGAGGILGALLTYPFADFLTSHTFEMLSIIVGGLLYTALTDIFPSFKEKGTTKHKILYLFLMIIGIFLFSFFHYLVELF